MHNKLLTNDGLEIPNYREPITKTPWLTYRIQNTLFFALLGKIDGTLNQGQMGIGLGEIAQHTFGLEIQVLAEKPQMVAITEQALELLQGLFFLPDLEQAVDETKGTPGEGGGGQPKIILVTLTVQKPIMAEALFHGLHRAHIPGIPGLYEAVGFHEKYRGIQMP